MLAAGAAFTESAADVAPETIGRLTAGFGLSLILVPFAFLAATFLSARDDAPVFTLAGMGLTALVGAPLLVLGNPAAALISGYAAGAVVALSRPAGTTLRYRVVAAVVVAVVVHAGFLVAPAATAWLAPAMPFTAMGIADALTPPGPHEVGAA